VKKIKNLNKSISMNEAETRAELIDPKLKACGWGVVEGSKILREYHITAGKIQTGGVRAKKLTADYVRVYNGINFGVYLSPDIFLKKNIP
jgi:type I restriction enzyme R subunit